MQLYLHSYCLISYRYEEKACKTQTQTARSTAALPQGNCRGTWCAAGRERQKEQLIQQEMCLEQCPEKDVIHC